MKQLIALPILFLCLLCRLIKCDTGSIDLPALPYDDNRNDDKNVAEDMILIGTADGMIHAFNSEHDERWVIDTGGPTATAYNSEHRQYAVLPSADGTIYINSREGMTKTSVKARMIAEKASEAPFISNQDNLIFTGHKTSRLLGIDVRSGRIIHDTGGPGSKLTPATDHFLTNKPSSDIHKKPLWLGRTDYSFRAFDWSTGM